MKPPTGQTADLLREAPKGLDSHHRARRLVFSLLILGLFSLYAVTTCPTVYPGDSGELIAAAFSLGVPHNSGYPLYSLLGKAASFLPLGSIGYRLNLFSCLTVALAMALLASVVLDWTGSRGVALSTAVFLAFTAKVWGQSGSAEVYGLHILFVVLLIRLLFVWDRDQQWWVLAMLGFASGLSFGNHLQTVMLGPGVLLVILSRDRHALLRPGKLILIALLFTLPLMLYLFLPIRTGAGAAITWGDPDTWERFLAHVTATSHRHGYVFNQSASAYVHRAAQALQEIRAGFGPLLLVAAWGWWKLKTPRWKVFFLLVFGFDMVYTVFLNTVALEITPFSLPTYVALTLLLGVGIQNARNAAARLSSAGAFLRWSFRGGLCLLPIIPFVSHLDCCDQHRNYAAYEHATNLFRTLAFGNTLIMDGDNNVFPIAYGRIAERMREDVQLVDRQNVLFKFPGGDGMDDTGQTPASLRKKGEREILASSGKGREVYYAVFSPYGIDLPKPYRLRPFGLLQQVASNPVQPACSGLRSPWPYYTEESVYDTFFKDYMTREICAFYAFSKGMHGFRTGSPEQGLAALRLASRIGYDDQLVHSEIGVFLTDMGLYEEARKELEIASVYHESLRVVHNNWGYFYQQVGEYARAAEAFRRVLELAPECVGDHNNLGFALYELGEKEEALRTFRRSLSLDPNQPEIERFILRKLDPGFRLQDPPEGKRVTEGKNREESRTHLNDDTP